MKYYTKKCFSHFVKPKLYSDINLIKPKEYSDIENFKLKFGVQDDYEIIKKIGRGRYSEVYEGYNIVKDNRVVIKIIKPIKSLKIKRETIILTNLNGQNNIISLADMIVDEASRTPSLVYNYINAMDWKELYPLLSDTDIRYYIYRILEALDYSHSMGIIHRDIKPQNIIIDPFKRILKVIDWGLAEFYFPGKDYSVKVASRYFKAPELLVNNTKYDYSLDIWSLGCLMAGMIFKKEPFFRGSDNQDQLVQIVNVMGYNDMKNYLEKYKLRLENFPLDKVINKEKKNFEKFIKDENRHLCPPDAINLLGKMLIFDHSERITPKEAMDHSYFDPIRKMIRIK